MNLTFHKHLIVLLVLLSSLELLPIVFLFFKPKNFNFGETRIGNLLREWNNDYYTYYVSWTSFTILTVYLSILVWKSKFDMRSKIFYVFCLLSLNYIFVIPIVNIWNLVLFIVCKNPPIHIEKAIHFPESTLFEQAGNFQVIRKEILDYVETNTVPCLHELVPDIRISSKRHGDNCWRFLQLKTAGTFKEQYRKHMPTLYALLDSPNISNAVISSLDPGMSIPPHRGYFKGYLRYHLGIDIPTDKQPYLVCGGETYYWKTGEGMLFDDMYLHHVNNPSNYKRVVLYLDVKRTHAIPNWVRMGNELFYRFIDNNVFVKLFVDDQHKQRSKEQEG